MDLFTFANSPCPCGSGNIVRECCSNLIVPQRAITQPPPPQTEYAHPNCYAAPLNDCSIDITREHYVSKGLLEALVRVPPLRLSGYGWQAEGAVLETNLNAPTAKILCSRHNEALSPLDVVGANLFRALDQMNEEFAGEATQTMVWPKIFIGNDIERWILKLLYGAIVSGTSRDENRQPLTTRPSLKGLQQLFHAETLEPPQGLYVIGSPGDTQENLRTFVFTPMFRDEEVAGIMCQFPALTLALNLMDEPLPTSFYRPQSIMFRHGTEERQIVFGWIGNNHREHINFDVIPYRNPM